MGPTYPQRSLKVEEGGREREFGGKGDSKRMVREMQDCFEKGPQAKEYRRPLEPGKGKRTDQSPEPPEGMQLCQHLDFTPLRPMPDF